MCFANVNLVLAGRAEDCGTERQKGKLMCGKEHTRTGQSSHVCEPVHTHTRMCVHTQGGTGETVTVTGGRQSAGRTCSPLPQIKQG